MPSSSGSRFGAANIVVSVLVLALSWALRAHIGLGTLMNALLIGLFVIVLTGSDNPIASLSEQGLGVRIALLVVALPFFGVGSAFYICASMGAGPRDSLMLVTSQRLGIRIGAARTGSSSRRSRSASRSAAPPGSARSSSGSGSARPSSSRSGSWSARPLPVPQ